MGIMINALSFAAIAAALTFGAFYIRLLWRVANDAIADEREWRQRHTG